MVEDFESLEFNLTRSMTYTLSRLNEKMEERKRLLKRKDIDSYEKNKRINILNKEIDDLKEDFVREFRIENIDEINYYWYIRSKG